MSLDELLQLERWLEDGTKGLLSDACPNVYGSRDAATATTPRIVVRAIVGEVTGNAHILSDAKRKIFDAWTGTLELIVSTSRPSSKDSHAHHELLGQVRARLLQISIAANWRTHQENVLIADIREGGTEDSFTDEQGIDVTKLSHNILFSINPDKWPDNL